MGRQRSPIDDFGTGYSSLAYLPPAAGRTEIKIDRSFVATMDHDHDDAVIVRSTIDLARNLGLRVVAEGVETADVSRRWSTSAATARRATTSARRCRPTS